MSDDRIHARLPDLAAEFRARIEMAELTWPADTFVVVHVDGQAFATFTKDLQRPFDDRFMAAMDAAAVACCARMAGVRLAYVQSDEISIILPPQAEAGDRWFGGRSHKIASVAASIATAAFAQAFHERVPERRHALATFAARSVPLPDAEEVIRWLAWRQLDAVRNSMRMVAQECFGHDALVGTDLKEMLARLREIGAPWDGLADYYRLGRCVVREAYIGVRGGERQRWVVMREIPFFPEHTSWLRARLTPTARGGAASQVRLVPLADDTASSDGS